MAKTAQVVIGANYGDEGKGLMTDYFAERTASAEDDVLVIRFNGGAQAGHTVATADGIRHVFGHVGSGTLTGAATFLSRHFVCNPQAFGKEVRALQAQINMLLPLIMVDPRALVTTPYDMLINQFTERNRGTARHGSCGLGFGETIARSEQPAFSLSAGDLRKGDGFLLHRLDRIRHEYIAPRLAHLGFTDIFAQQRDLIFSDSLMYDFVSAAAGFIAMAEVATPEFLAVGSMPVMEGAQGLLLDQTRGAFPYVTRSNTGLRNALDVAHEAGITRLEVTYVTRAYLTRHGAGPLPNELPSKPYIGISDPTNIDNEFQGGLRFAYLDVDALADAIRTDLADARGKLNVSHHLAITCLDQVGPQVHFYADGVLHEAPPATLMQELMRRIEPERLFCSYGPTRQHVAEIAITRNGDLKTILDTATNHGANQR